MDEKQKQNWFFWGAAWVLFVAAVVSLLCHVAIGAEINAEERVIELPKDGEKWYISVIGNPDDARYESILRRFDRDKNLKALKSQVHFWIVPSNGDAFKERYQKNTKVLPTIRMQESGGRVVWEASAGNIPITAKGLYNAMRTSSAKALAILPWRRNGTVLPWRNQMEQKCQPGPCPPHAPVLVVPDPTPAPLDDGGPPKFEETGPSRWYMVLAAIASALAGGGYGLLTQWRKATE